MLSAKKGRLTHASAFLGSEKRSALAAALRELPMPKAARILLVDDRDDVRESIAEILTAAQYTVVAATDGEKALSILANDPSFDLLFTDIALGSRLSGYELAQRAVQLKPSLRVLYTTGYSWNLEDLHAAVPGSRMLRKPYRAHDLL